MSLTYFLLNYSILGQLLFPSILQSFECGFDYIPRGYREDLTIKMSVDSVRIHTWSPERQESVVPKNWQNY